MPGGQLRPLLEIPCNPEVTHKDIDKYVNYCEHDCKNCRHIMQKARMTVTKASKSRRENFEICCYGDHISLCFWSGSRGNEVVIQMDEEKIQHDKTRSAWREWLRQAWKRFKERFRTRQGLEGEERTALEHN